MPLCPDCGAEVQKDDIFCGNCGGDLREAMELEEAVPAEPIEEDEGLPPAAMEEREEGTLPPVQEEEEVPAPTEALAPAEAPAWTSPTSRTLWIVVIVVLAMLLCCCGTLSLIALTRILGSGPML
jgi:hypothetical protein